MRHWIVECLFVAALVSGAVAITGCSASEDGREPSERQGRTESELYKSPIPTTDAGPFRPDGGIAIIAPISDTVLRSE